MAAEEKDVVEDKKEKEKEENATERRKKSRKTKAKNEEPKTPKTILRNKDTPRSKSRVVIKEEQNIEYEKEQTKRGISVLNRNTPAINTPLRGNPDSPLKPYKFRPGDRTSRSSLMRLTTPATISFSSRQEERKPIDLQAGKKATQELFSAIRVGTRMLEFKEMLKVKVTIGMEAHIPRDTLENLNTFEKIMEELSVLWKINRYDVDILEHLLQKIGMLERFTPDLEKYKNDVKYNDLPASTEREVTTIIASLHNLLQSCEEANRNYTTMCFLHFGNVYGFTRARLNTMKSEMSSLLRIQPTQMTYLGKVASDTKGYLTLFQMPCSVTRKIVTYVKKNNDTLMSLGLKGVQITGSDGLRYTQSLSYLQEKVAVATQTSFEGLEPSRNIKTAMSISSLPPLVQQQLKLKSSSTSRPETVQKSNATAQSRLNFANLHDNWGITTPAPSPHKEDPSMVVQPHPNDEKFERRVSLLRSTLDSLSQTDVDQLINILLEQIQALHRTIASLKKDLKEKSRELNASQGFVSKAEKGIKTMELRLETKAHQISEINQQLVKRIKTVMNENSRLKDMLQEMDAEIDIHRQIEKENRFGNSVRAVRLTRPIQGIL